jgi:UDP-2,3-diacylglucosamine hydrolase
MLLEDTGHTGTINLSATRCHFLTIFFRFGSGSGGTKPISMSVFQEIPYRDIVFVADTHFRDRRLPGEAERRERFLRFLGSLDKDVGAFLIGDIFDFYFEYRSVVSNRYVEIFAALADAASRGVDLHFLGGNHDYWVGDFARRELGMTIHRDEILLSAQGRKIVVAHGDLVMPRDNGYKILKTIIRNPAVIGLSRWIHPDIMDSIATRVATGSRRLKKASQEKRARVIADHAHARFFSRGNDAFVMGHVHYPLHDVRDGKEFLIVGDWIQDYTYGRLRDGRLTLESVTNRATD